jgi:signal transduction histidine kinase
LLVFYIGQGTAIIFLLRSRQQSTPAFRMLVHGADIIWPALVSLFTSSQSNPFFLFFIFVLAAAAYRWGLWETVMTSAASVAMLWLDSLAIRLGGIWRINQWLTHHHLPIVRVDIADFQPKRLFMRSVYLIVMGLLLGYLAEQQKKLRAEKDVTARLLGLVRLDSGLATTLSNIAGGLLKLYGARRAIIASRDSADRRVSVAILELKKGIAELQWIDPGVGGSETYLRHTAATSWWAKSSRDTHDFRIVGLDSEGALLREVDSSAARHFAQVHPFESLTAISFSFGQELSGRLFILDPKFASSVEEELRFLQDLVRQLAPAVYNLYLIRRLRRRAGALERARLVRELHDGAVQSLIGVEMQVDVLRRSFPVPHSEDDPGSSLGSRFMAGELERIQNLLREEVLKLRELMQQMKSTEIDARRLPSFLQDVVQRFQRETGIAARFVPDDEEIALPAMVCRELARIAQEALVNVRKHSGATHVMVQLLHSDGTWDLIIEDDGAGFPFAGRVSQSELDSSLRAPAVIRERVRLIQGELTIESKPGQGARIEIKVPQPQVTA